MHIIIYDMQAAQARTCPGIQTASSEASSQLIHVHKKRYLDLILYVSANIYSVISGRVFLGCTSTKQRIKCLTQGHKAVPPMRLEPTNPR